MKGKMTKVDNDWCVMVTQEGDWETYYSLHPDNVEEIKRDSQVFDNIDARISSYPDVEFEIIEICRHHDNDCPCREGFKQYARLVKETIDGWEFIFQEIEGSLHSELPIRVKNWLRNKFYSPVKK
jgi:hypothetical protein